METIEQTIARITGFIKDTFPDADVAPGSVINELVIKLAASVQNEQFNLIDDFLQASSIKKALNSTTDTYNVVIDEIASNYNLVRSAGSKSTGVIKVFVSSNRDYLINKDMRFYQPALNLYYEVASEIRFSSDPIEGEEKLYFDGTLYYFLLPVQAVDVGSFAQVQSGAPFDLAEGVVLNDFVSAQAYGNFTTGLPVETDKQLISRLQEGLSHRTLMSQTSITSALKASFPTIQTVSVVGAGDAELLRSKRNVLGLSTLGMADVYVRSSIGLETISFIKAATKTAANTWSMTLGADDYPGFYDLSSIRSLNAAVVGSFQPSSKIFGFNVPSSQRVNRVLTAQDARFSVYQTCDVVFSYNESPTVSIGSTQEFEVTVSYQPYLREIQSLFLADSSRVACADYLVKAVLPCFVVLSLKLTRNSPTDEVPVDLIKRDIFNYINTIPFGISLSASKIVDICHNYNIKRVELPISMIGTIFTNDGSTITLSSSDQLIIPQNIELGVSNKTTMFFINYVQDGDDNIGIEVI